MSTMVLDPMTKPSKPKRDDKAAKIDRRIVNKANFVADMKGISLAEYLSGLLENLVDEDWRIAVRDVEKRKKPSNGN